MNKPRNAGTAAETAYVRYLRDQGWTTADRSPLRGHRDAGDTIGVPFVNEVKWQSRRKPVPSMWLFELDAEVHNARAEFGHVVYSPPGVGVKSIDKWISLMRQRDAARLLDKAGVTDVTFTREYSGRDLAFGSRLEILDTERVQAGSLFAAGVIRPLRVDDPDRYYNIMWLPQRLELFRLAGMGGVP